MDFSQVKALSIPEGEVTKIQIGGVTVWQSAAKAVYNLYNVWSNPDYTSDTAWTSVNKEHSVTNTDGTYIWIRATSKESDNSYPLLNMEDNSIVVRSTDRTIKKVTIKFTPPSSVWSFDDSRWNYQQSTEGGWIYAGGGSSGGSGSGIYSYDASGKSDVHALSFSGTTANLPYRIEYIIVEYN